jgi:hypothetical protein
VLAWLGICFAGLASVLGIVQNLLFAGLSRGWYGYAELRSSTVAPDTTGSAPGYSLLHARILFALFLVMPLLGLIASVGLLQRRNWARLVFMALLTLGIGYDLMSLAALMKAHPALPILTNMPAGFAPDFATIFRIARIVGTLLTLASGTLFAWLLYRLQSHPVRAEFAPAPG